MGRCGWTQENLDSGLDTVSTVASTKSQPSYRLIRIVVGIVLLVAIAWFIEPQTFLQTISSISPYYFLGMLATALFGRFLRAWKWNVLLRARGVTISTWQALRMSLVSHFAGAWTPGQLGGDAYRLYALRDFQKTDVVLSTLLIERYAGLLTVCCFVMVGLPVTIPYLAQVSPWMAPMVLGMVALVLSVVPCLLSRRLLALVRKIVPGLRGSKLEAKVRGFYQTVAAFRDHPAALGLFGIAAMAEMLSYFVLNFLAARSLGLDVSLVFFLFAMPIVHMLLRIPISFQALGIQEGCFAYALLLHGFDPAEGLAVSVVQRALEWIFAIGPGGLLLWLTSGPSPYEAAAELRELDVSSPRRCRTGPLS